MGRVVWNRKAGQASELHEPPFISPKSLGCLGIYMSVVVEVLKVKDIKS